MARFTLLMLVFLALLVPSTSWGQEPHFTSCTSSIASGELTLTGQIAGLGNQTRPIPLPLVLEATAVAVCLDPTTTPPSLLGFTPVADTVTFPPKNGQRRYAFVLDTPFVLPCDPPAEVVFVAVQVCDTTHDICCPEPEPEPE